VTALVFLVLMFVVLVIGIALCWRVWNGDWD
jgi:hypothetical protein